MTASDQMYNVSEMNKSEGGGSGGGLKFTISLLNLSSNAISDGFSFYLKICYLTCALSGLCTRFSISACPIQCMPRVYCMRAYIYAARNEPKE